MKKCKRLSFLLLTALVLFAGCLIPNLGWVYDLPNGYQIVMSGPYITLTSDNMVTYKVRFEQATVPGRQTVRMALNERYTGLIMVNQADFKIYSLGAEVPMYWYIVDEVDEVLYGPYYTEDVFDAALKRLKVPNLGPWRELGTIGRVRPFIVRFCYNDRFIGVKNINVRNTEEGEETYEEWYVLDGEIDVVHGPYYSEQEYTNALSELEISGLGDWISTTSKPEGAH